MISINCLWTFHISAVPFLKWKWIRCSRQRHITPLCNSIQIFHYYFLHCICIHPMLWLALYPRENGLNEERVMWWCWVGFDGEKLPGSHCFDLGWIIHFLHTVILPPKVTWRLNLVSNVLRTALILDILSTIPKECKLLHVPSALTLMSFGEVTG